LLWDCDDAAIHLHIRVWFLGTDAGSDQVGAGGMLGRDVSGNISVWFFRQYCLLHQNALIVKRQLARLNPFWGQLAKIVNLWRTSFPGSWGGVIIQDVALPSFDTQILKLPVRAVYFVISPRTDAVVLLFILSSNITSTFRFPIKSPQLPQRPVFLGAARTHATYTHTGCRCSAQRERSFALDLYLRGL
jgi:hypothetical protein